LKLYERKAIQGRRTGRAIPEDDEFDKGKRCEDKIMTPEIRKKRIPECRKCLNNKEKSTGICAILGDCIYPQTENYKKDAFVSYVINSLRRQ